MGMTKKGVFFTLMAILVVVLIIAVVSTRDKYRNVEKANAIRSRVETMDDFVSDYEKEVKRELFIGGYRALISMNVVVRQTQGYIQDFDSVFSEILINGTFNGTQMDLMSQEGAGADIQSWLGRVNEESALLNINVATVVEQISVVHVSPWEVKVTLNMTSHITDSKDVASWEINKDFSHVFSVIGFEDPLYIIGTGDRMTALINETPDYDFVDDATNDTSVLKDHITNSFYISSNSSPSWLMRFSGNLSPSSYGIESIIDAVYLSSQIGAIEPRSLVDYIYFGNLTTSDYCTANNMPSWLRIDSAHLQTYELDKLNPQLCT